MVLYLQFTACRFDVALNYRDNVIYALPYRISQTRQFLL